VKKSSVSIFKCLLTVLILIILTTSIALADDLPLFQSKNQIHYEVSTTELSSAPLAALAQKITKTVNGITFDSNYDNGSLLDITSTAANTFSGSLYVEPGELGTSKYWFRFRMTGIAGRTITINMDHTQNPRPVISFDSVTWRRLTSTEAPTTSRMVLTFGSATNFAEVAFFYPMGYGETFSKVSSLLLANPYGTITVIGQSFQGKDMLMVTVTDTTVPNTGKHRVWIHSRAHAGEATGTYCMLGFLEKVLENTTTGRQLRKNCIFNIVPLLNCDGVFLGQTRWDSQGIDPERLWDTTSRIPEVANLRTQVDACMSSVNPIQVALNLHSTVSVFADTFFWKHISPSVTTTFENIQQRYINALDSATPLFGNLAPQTSTLDPTKFIESYFWNNWHESVMAMTHEGHYYTRITDGQYITGDDYKEIGRSQAVALVSYFNLPPLTGVDDWCLY
jgi:hypothetical protein